MTNKPTWRLIGILCSVMLLLFVWPALAQTPTPPPTPREALIEAIQARAQRDVELAKPVEGVAALEVLFGTEAANVGLSMVEVLGVYEEAYTAATPVKPWWEDLRPQAGWIAAIILFVLVIFRDALKDSLSKAIKWLLERIYLRLAGFRPFWGLALNRYRRALVARYERLNIPFRSGRPLEMREVYVPLKVSDAQTPDLIDAYRAVVEHKWLMITGAPGAGKTMLLRHLALHYAEGGLADFPTQPVPVLLELNRLSESEQPLETHLAQALKANDFPGGERFIAAGLEHGLLLLLFDGLDEVARDTRPRVVRQIKDLLQAHPKVRAIITCRTAVYDGEFDTLVQQRLEIAEFSDQQIQRFLSSWQAQMPPGKSPEHLLRNLRERPHIMGLARNPLLLTIIAYLYTDTPFVLPHSRTAFYDKSLAVLLEQWDAARGTPNRYTVDEKQLVLQHLALFFQDHAARGGGDRRSVDLPTVLAEIAGVLPALSRKAEDTRPLLDEIVARSGLLLAVDGGLRYQFAHLTLQEFFTAQKLQDDTIGLLERFRADPDAWRETLKLWCGLPHDSTTLIRALYAEHSILAFECLGDAQQVDQGLAQEIITAFQARLGEDGATGEAVTRAFATVATNPQRGKPLFDFLIATVKDIKEPARRRAAAQALAWSNLPQAAEVLAAYAPDYPDAPPLLAQMGDLATPIVAKQAKHGYHWAVDALQAIGTPAAAYALADLLWEDNDILALFPPAEPWGDQYFCYRAAWHLAALIANPIIENAFREYPLTESQRKLERLDWVWEPFEPDANSPLRTVAERMAYLLYKTPPDCLPELRRAYDPRILLPLCTVVAAQEGLIKACNVEDYRQFVTSLPPMSALASETDSPDSLTEPLTDFLFSENDCYSNYRCTVKEISNNLLDQYLTIQHSNQGKTWLSKLVSNQLSLKSQHDDLDDGTIMRLKGSQILCSFVKEQHFDLRDNIEWLEKLRGSWGSSGLALASQFEWFLHYVRYRSEILPELSDDSTWQYIFVHLTPNCQIEWLRRLKDGARLPDIADWRNFQHPMKYQFTQSWHMYGLRFLVALLPIMSMVQLLMVVFDSSHLIGWGDLMNLVIAAVTSAWFIRRISLWKSLHVIEADSLTSLCGFGTAIGAVIVNVLNPWGLGLVGGFTASAMGLSMISIAFNKFRKLVPPLLFYTISAALGSLISYLIGSSVIAPLLGALVVMVLGKIITSILPISVVVDLVKGVIVVPFVYWSSLLVSTIGGVWGISVFWLAWLIIFGVVVQLSRRSERAAENPLHGLLPDLVAVPTTLQRRGLASPLPLGFLFRRSRKQPGSR